MILIHRQLSNRRVPIRGVLGATRSTHYLLTFALVYHMR